MPYIVQSHRDILDPDIESLQNKLKELGLTEGDLNYVITRLVARYFKEEPRYKTIANITGVLVNVKNEFYRRIAAAYEDKACMQNGDIKEFSSIYF